MIGPQDDITHDDTSKPPLPEEADVEKARAWELVDVGRYMPRRIRGSFLGRELG